MLQGQEAQAQGPVAGAEAKGLQVRSFGQQLLESVAYLHELRLIHTDLKPENILLASLEAGRASAPADGRCAALQSQAGQWLEGCHKRVGCRG